MWILFKNISRYVYQRKFSIFGIFLLLLISIMIFVTFGFLSTNLMNAYQNLVQNGNLANIVVDEDYKPNPPGSTASQNISETEFDKALSNLGVAYRQFNSVNITTANSHLFKIIDYPVETTIDRLVVFNQSGTLPESNGHPTLPTGVNFDDLFVEAQAAFTTPNGAQLGATTAVRDLVYYAAKADWSTQTGGGGNGTLSIPEALSLASIYTANNPSYNPLDPKSASDTAPEDTRIALGDVAEYLKIWLDPASANYTPPVTNGYRITFSLANLPSNTLHIPILGYYTDFSSYLAIVSPTYLTDNHKKIYDYATFLRSVNGTGTGMITQQAFTSYFDSISPAYKVFVDKVPYLIVGSGISPGFMYPIINFQNVIPNPQTQGIVYTNTEGYNRIQFSFPTAPTEDMLVCKYVGHLPLGTVVKDVNELAHQYMAFPSNMTLAYAYNNTANTFSPTGLRVAFVTKLVLSIRVVSVLISLFILIMSLVVIILFTKKFIEDNQTVIAIMLANGISRPKIIFSISLIGWLPSLLAGLTGFLIGFFTQTPMISLFSTYWMIPTPTATFNVGELFLAIFCTLALFIALIFAWSAFSLRKGVMELMKEPTSFKLNFVTIFFKKWMDWAPTLVKFRFSIAFSSLGKILLLSVVSLITTVMFLFIASTAGAFQTALSLAQKTNRATFAVNLTTPTLAGGQYAAEAYNIEGQPITTYPNLPNAPHTVINNLHYNSASSPYHNSYQYLKTWSGMFWPSYKNLEQLSENLTFLRYHTSIQFLSNNQFGIKGGPSSNPWSTTMAMIPANQANTSIALTNALVHEIMSDMEPLTWIPYSANFKPSGDGEPNQTATHLTPAAVGVPMFQEWVIGNIGITNPGNWVDNAGSPEIGFINANKIPALAGDNLATIVGLSPSALATDLDATYPNLFVAGKISNLQPWGKTGVVFRYAATGAPNVITLRSLFLKYIFTPETATNRSAVVYPDPFDTNVNYIPDNDNVYLGGIPTRYSVPYIQAISHILSDPLFQPYLYKFTYDSLVWNPQMDEPYTYVAGNLPNYATLHTPYRAPKTIQINGIIPNSSLIQLYDTQGHLINHLLFQTLPSQFIDGTSYPVYPLIPNAYAMQFYNLHVGQILCVNPMNSVYRYTPDFLAKLAKGAYQAYYKIVAVSNAVHGASFWTSMAAAQKTLGLATAKDYATQTAGPMNNAYNSFGGFNGILTSQAAPFLLTKNIALYSPSGLYPGTSGFSKTGIFVTLMENNIADYTSTEPSNAGLNLVFQALYLNPDQNLYTSRLAAIAQLPASERATSPATRALALSLIGALQAKYGAVAYDSIIEKPVSYQDMAAMFASLSSTVTKIKLMIAIIIVVISLLIMFLLAWIIINDFLRIAALLKTQGYSDWDNTMNFFSLFIPVWLIDVVLTIPLTLLILHFYRHFIFTGVGVLLAAPINGGIFVGIILALTGVFLIIFGMALAVLKRLNLIEVLKW